MRFSRDCRILYVHAFRVRGRMRSLYALYAHPHVCMCVWCNDHFIYNQRVRELIDVLCFCFYSICIWIIHKIQLREFHVLKRIKKHSNTTTTTANNNAPPDNIGTRKCWNTCRRLKLLPFLFWSSVDCCAFFSTHICKWIICRTMRT